MNYLLTAYFTDGMVLGEKGGTTIAAIEHYQGIADLIYVDLNNGSFAYGYQVNDGKFGINGTWFMPGENTEVLKNTSLILQENKDNSVTFGYNGENSNGVREFRAITIS